MSYEAIVNKARACGAQVTQHEVGFSHGEFERFLAAHDQAVIANFLERTGQYVTNDASREAAIADALRAQAAEGGKEKAEAVIWEDGTLLEPLSEEEVFRFMKSNAGPRNSVTARTLARYWKTHPAVKAAEGEQSAAQAAGQEEHSLSWCDLEYAERTLQWIADRKMVMGDGTIERIDDIRSAARVAKEAHRRIARALPILAATPAPAHPLPVAGEEVQKLTVWFGSMPESNGKANWTAILHRRSESLLGGLEDGFTLARSEYHDRVRYDADCVRHLLGELPERPDILAYDGNMKSPLAHAAPAGETKGGE